MNTAIAARNVASKCFLVWGERLMWGVLVCSLSDALYTLPFALIGMREAYGATGEQEYVEAESRLIDYLVRIQVTSRRHPELSGAWFRAFDYRSWEYWASDNDWGYGPWTTETG